MGAREALRMLLDVGIESIERRILDLTDYLMESITKLGLELQTPQERAYRSGIVNFRVKNPKEVAEKLDKKGIVVSARANGIRVSPHFYNTEDEIDKLIEEVRQYS
jgi:selenocysteine lyase/cysteine desulfurase